MDREGGGGGTRGVVDVLEGCDSAVCKESDLCRAAGGGFSGEVPAAWGWLPCEVLVLGWLPCEAPRLPCEAPSAPPVEEPCCAELTLAEVPKGAKKPGDSCGREEQMETATLDISM